MLIDKEDEFKLEPLDIEPEDEHEELSDELEEEEGSGERMQLDGKIIKVIAAKLIIVKLVIILFIYL